MKTINQNRIPATETTVTPQNKAFAPETTADTITILDIMDTILDAPVADGQYAASLREYCVLPGVTADRTRISMTWSVKTDTGLRTLKPQQLSPAQFTRFLEQAQLALKIIVPLKPAQILELVMADAITIWITRQGAWQNLDLVPPYVKASNGVTPPPAKATSPI